MSVGFIFINTYKAQITRTSGTKRKISGWLSKASVNRNDNSAKAARVIPQVGHGMVVRLRTTQPPTRSKFRYTPPVAQMRVNAVISNLRIICFIHRPSCLLICLEVYYTKKRTARKQCACIRLKMRYNKQVTFLFNLFLRLKVWCYKHACLYLISQDKTTP